jgi:hypothetical protein
MIQTDLFSIGLEFYNDQISRRPSNKVHKILCENRISFLIDLKFYFYFIFSALFKMLYLVYKWLFSLYLSFIIIYELII